MGQHKYNPNCELAKKGLLPPKGNLVERGAFLGGLPLGFAVKSSKNAENIENFPLLLEKLMVR